MKQIMYQIGISFIFHFWVANCYGLEETYFSKTPINVDVVSGKSVTLPCQVVPSAGIQYYWELNGSKLANTTRRYQQNSNLHITRVDREKDSGDFTCIAQDLTGASITSSAASLNIQWIGDVTIQLQSPESESFISSGSDVILRCHVEGSGDIHYEWFRNSVRLAKTAKMDIRKKKLHLKSVTSSDNGVYRCTAQNEAGLKHSSKNFVLAVPGEQTALLTVAPLDQIVKKGTIAHFDCVYKNADTVEWYFKDVGPLIGSERIVVHPNGTLQIKDAQERDQGFYNCVGVRGESTEVPQSYTAELQIGYLHNLTAASFEPPLPDDATQIVAEGSFFQITCLEPRSLPPARKWWLNPKGHIVSDSGQTKVDDDARLIIERVIPENGGNYTCVAENLAGRTEKFVQLIVTTKPVIVGNPVSVTVNENEESTLTCAVASSDLYTSLNWKKDGKIIKYDDGGYQRIKIFKLNGTLHIESTKTSDRGEYICEVNTIGFAPVSSKPATISVIEKLKFSPPPVSKKLELGSSAKIHCKAQGTPPPIVHWQKEALNELPSHITDMNGTLHFNSVVADDKGKYVCSASNSQGVINITITVDVVVAPKFSVLPKNPTVAIEGASVMIDCVVEGDPKPTVQWDKNLKMNDFDHTRFTLLENGTLHIGEVRLEDANNYGCTAGSSAGLNRKEIKLIVHPNNTNEDDGEGSTVTKAVLITMSVAGAYIVLVIGLMIWCRYRRRTRKLPVSEEVKPENGDIEHTELKDGVNGHIPSGSKLNASGCDGVQKENQKSDSAETTHSLSSGHSKKSKSSNYDKLAVSRSHLKEIKLIGRGEFGDIMVAKLPKSAMIASEKDKSTNSSEAAHNNITEETDVFVMVKSLKVTKDEAALTEFKREIDIFSKLCHENVTKFYGLCREVEPHYLMLEYTDWGDLKKFLVTTQKGVLPPLTAAQCVAVIHQVAKGMDYFASSRLVHRDLAARNCLVTSTLTVKVGLLRLTRDPYSQEYCKHMNQIIPLRWLPYEAVYEDEYSTKSDVYAFGVLMLEIFNQGELPCPKINDTTFLNKLKEKSLEWKSYKTTPPELQKLQELCWDNNPQARPSFAHIVKEIEQVLKNM